ncbi:FecR domain-containing protein [Ferrimonas balearica]|nr:FecR domain-containing protein [Ferrimonas balearica]
MTEQDEDPARLADEALDRLIHLHSGNATDEDRSEWRLWKAQSTARAEAAREAEELWNGLGAAGAAWARGRRNGRLTRRALLLGGATVLGGAALHELGAIGPHLLADHRTGVAERRDIRLDDGTRVTMDARSALSDLTLNHPRQAELLRGRILIAGGRGPQRCWFHRPQHPWPSGHGTGRGHRGRGRELLAGLSGLPGGFEPQLRGPRFHLGDRNQQGRRRCLLRQWRPDRHAHRAGRGYYQAGQERRLPPEVRTQRQHVIASGRQSVWLRLHQPWRAGWHRNAKSDRHGPARHLRGDRFRLVPPGRLQGRRRRFSAGLLAPRSRELPCRGKWLWRRHAALDRAARGLLQQRVLPAASLPRLCSE